MLHTVGSITSTEKMGLGEEEEKEEEDREGGREQNIDLSMLAYAYNPSTWKASSPPSPEPSTSQLHPGTVVAQVLSIRRGGVALIKARVLGLQASNLEHHGISLQALYLQVTRCHTRPKDGIGELAIPGTDDA